MKIPKSGPLTTYEAAHLLGVSYPRLMQFIADGRIKHRRRNGIYLLDRQSVLRFKRIPRPSGRPPVKQVAQ